ncbi:Alanyl-tRNA synthetase [invertebrate metagenome]|uniref:Alanine--tRNA ligase n=1 Tax=invertebrate metagenome TaxID=1711999 RepID=A0A484H6X9_9ZZZZ
MNDVRTTFLSYFKEHGHEVVASSSLIPSHDPTLLFTNAGMVQFKNLFTGKESRTYRRATTAQKCIRAGGKHNDLDNVGHTARHHTFFEMLGNFSFGDYFKDTAIELAWDLITHELAVPAERLLVTVHASDEEAAVLWRRISGLSESRILRIPTADNFWQMGETGPCGPCSEIFYDHGPSLPGGPPGRPEADGDRFVEVWNLVFMQFEQCADGTRVPLPQPSIDTGMGLERIAAVLQGQHDNYDTDLLRALIEATAHITHTDPDGPYRIAHRVIADHLRSSGFLIADGVLPSNEGRGYVLRRILRRAIRHAYLMGARAPLLYALGPALIEQMGMTYPELARAESLITETLRLEEKRFHRTLERGLKLLDEQSAGLTPGSILPGEVAFRLYDTYGFPLDLTQDVLHDRALTVDTEGFEAAMAHQQAEARQAWTGSGESAAEGLWFELKGRIGSTEFLGYDDDESEAFVTVLMVNGRLVEQVVAETPVMLLASRTPFYGESGGQMGDTGWITVPGRGRVVVRDTLKKLGVLHVHVGRVENGVVTVGDKVHLCIDKARRAALRAHHSATHLLQAALHQILGRHVIQKGSLVAPDRLRFDISHPRAISVKELRAIEVVVNQHIRINATVTTRLMDPEVAIQGGATALCGEKYGDEVRVVSMGKTGSVELCGGTHVSRTGDIGLFCILGESAVATGVRRIEAVAGAVAEAHVAEQSAWLAQAADILKVTPAEVPTRVAALIEERRRSELEGANMRRRLALADNGGGTAVDGRVRKVAGISFAVRHLKDIPAKELKSIADILKQRLNSGVIVLVSDSNGKASVVVAVTDDLSQQISAVELVRAGARALGGKGGGGRPDLAQAGGPDIEAVPAALHAIERLLIEQRQV